MMSAGQLISLLVAYKYFILFPIAIFEGPIAIVVSGVLVSLHILNPLIVYVIIVAGDIIGDAMFYAIGRFGSKRITIWFTRLFKTDINAVTIFFHENVKKTLVLSKIIHSIGLGGIIVAGIVKIPYRTFFSVCLVVSLAQSLILLSLGIIFGSSYVLIEQYLGYTMALISTAALVLFTWWVLVKRRI